MAIQQATIQTQQAIAQATQQSAQGKAIADSTTHIVTFGALSFAIGLTPEGIYTHANQITSKTWQQTSPEHTQAKIASTKLLPPKNQHLKHTKRNDRYQQIGNPHRFVKVPQATNEWQEVTRKVKKAKKQSKKCFFCNRVGHIQRFCRKRIKCYKCGKNGHKYADCLFKRTHSSLRRSTAQKRKEKETQQSAANQGSPNMEILHERPPLGEIFCPSRTTLNEENEYLFNVGLIILISGSPSPDLPRLMAIKIAQTHGGHPNDYPVTQAMIAPYVLTCPSRQIRHVVVQRGLYTIPQAQVQFTVHEWRPRFGMGHDPSTHQIWVRIVGLPLQAWTVTEINGILQRFGHPLDVLPFGQEAGHYKHITALVATKSPRHIPLAYIYREGDYSTQIDIQILNWRVWENSYFPPPPPDTPPPFQGDSQFQQQQGSSPPAPGRHSPFSSTSEEPSEPTVDLSCWSPRSSWHIVTHTSKWIPKHKNIIATGYPFFNPPKQRVHGSTSSPQTLIVPATYLGLSLNRSHLSIDLYVRGHTSVTKNPTSICETQKEYSLMHFSLLSISHPIAFTPFPPLRTQSTPDSTLTESQNSTVTAAPHLAYALALMLSERKGNVLNAILSARAGLLQLKCQGQILQGPPGKTYPSPQHPRISSENKRVPSSSKKPPQTLPSPDQSHSDLMKHLLPETQKFSTITDSVSLENSNSTYTAETNSSPLGPTQDNTFVLQTENQEKEVMGELTETSSLCLSQSQSHLQTHSQLAQNPSSFTVIQHSNQSKGKEKKIATRKSQRIQEKMRSNQATPRLSREAKAKNAKIPFDLQPHDQPLDTNTALSILQASGLQITQQIENMIQEAAKNDRPIVQNDKEDSRPTTSLHDIIPPRVILGENLLL